MKRTGRLLGKTQIHLLGLSSGLFFSCLKKERVFLLKGRSSKEIGIRGAEKRKNSIALNLQLARMIGMATERDNLQVGLFVKNPVYFSLAWITREAHTRASGIPLQGLPSAAIR